MQSVANLAGQTTKQDGRSGDTEDVEDKGEDETPSRITMHVRENEKLVVESVSGNGRLYVDVFDTTRDVQVIRMGAVHDSQASWWLDGKDVPVHPDDESGYPGPFRYDFYALPLPKAIVDLEKEDTKGRKNAAEAEA